METNLRISLENPLREISLFFLFQVNFLYTINPPLMFASETVFILNIFYDLVLKSQEKLHCLIFSKQHSKLFPQIIFLYIFFLFSKSATAPVSYCRNVRAFICRGYVVYTDLIFQQPALVVTKAVTWRGSLKKIF